MVGCHIDRPVALVRGRWRRTTAIKSLYLFLKSARRIPRLLVRSARWFVDWPKKPLTSKIAVSGVCDKSSWSCTSLPVLAGSPLISMSYGDPRACTVFGFRTRVTPGVTTNKIGRRLSPQLCACCPESLLERGMRACRSWSMSSSFRNVGRAAACAMILKVRSRSLDPHRPGDSGFKRAP
jgi:hypothetical protein